MLTRARPTQPSNRIPTRYWEGDEPDGPDADWLPSSAHGRGLAISNDAAWLQTELEALVTHVLARWRLMGASAPQRLDHDWRRFLDQLHASFDAEPLEDGMDHPAEQVITAALESEDRDTALKWISSACLGSESPAFAAATFLCAARHPGIGTATWRAGLVHRGLASDDIELRDAAIQAAELWGDPGLGEILMAHSEPVSWLDEYRRGVIDDLLG